MTYIVGHACINCKFSDCVETCPVEAFFEGPNMLVIDPDICIDCGACEPACPVDAINDENNVPSDEQEFVSLNAKLCKEWPSILKKKDPMPEADKWKDEKQKRRYLLEK